MYRLLSDNMAASVMADFPWRFLISALAVYICYRFSKSLLSRFFKYTFAVFMNRFAPHYNRLTKCRKETLFSVLHQRTKTMTRKLDILEIGAGSGANFRFYPHGTNVTCVEPNANFDTYLKSNSDKVGNVNLKGFAHAVAEDMPVIGSASFDAVVCTLVLCSVNDIDQCLQEIKRVLRPGGLFLFMEHVAAARDTWLSSVQRLINPVWTVIADGCNLTRDTHQHMDRAGFAKVNQEHFYVGSRDWISALMFPPVLRPHIAGVATIQ